MDRDWLIDQPLTYTTGIFYDLGLVRGNTSQYIHFRGTTFGVQAEIVPKIALRKRLAILIRILMLLP